MKQMLAHLPKLGISLLLLGGFLSSAHAAHAATYYVSPSGSDTQPGTTTQPWKTFARSIKALQAGDTLVLQSGTYTERLFVSDKTTGTTDKPIIIRSAPGTAAVIDGTTQTTFPVQLSGSYVELHGVTVQNSLRSGCVRANGHHLTLHGLLVNGCQNHGVQIDGQHVTLQHSTITNSSRENAQKQGKWSSGVKVMIGGEDVLIKRNRVHKNYGEGVAVTRGKRVTVDNNDIYDNFSVNLYIDNSIQVQAKNNLVLCKDNPEFLRDGRRATGISLSEESYSGWGSQLSDITVDNNISAYCHRGISYYSAEVSNPGLRNSTFTNNILWGSQDYALYVGAFPETTATTISDNVIHQEQGKLVKLGSGQGLSLHHNWWVGNTVPTIAQGEGDRYGMPTFVTTPGYSRESFAIVK